ncbi:uncharacterized protein LOC112202807 isoform X4 [Rosa chinensis]|uniref:uncharacterized protein LOC112202807 isoform X4 n=1 Tax=Rosa chinensis TaxID=74649 RepID=UPI000D08B563|nr:uncharacterized protein LOC112202807 isoform X4 [Rosa chinensis]
MDKMDTSNGIAWFGNIFQKFEDMYHDVDELVKQAESQLVTVGANVKNFFAELDLIGDAVPQSSVDKKPGAAPGTSVVQKTDDAVSIKSLEGTDGGCGDGVHIGSVESVKSVSSGLSLEQVSDNQTPDKKDSINANQEIGLDIGAKLLIPASDDVGECNSFTEAEDRSTNLVDMSSKFSDEKKDSSNANEEIGLDSGAKLLIPALDDIGGFNSFMETEDRSRNLVDLCSKISDDMRLSNALEMDILCKKSTADLFDLVQVILQLICPYLQQSPRGLNCMIVLVVMNQRQPCIFPELSQTMMLPARACKLWDH